MDDFFQKVFPKNNILALKDVEDDASDSGLVGSTVCWQNNLVLPRRHQFHGQHESQSSDFCPFHI
jgi:hypothetical protein